MKVLDFGITKKGEKTHLFVLKNEYLECQVTDYGSSLVKVLIPDRNGKIRNIVLGFGEVSGYETDTESIGCNVGRCANRIAEGTFELNGMTYQLDRNLGGHTLHSGYQRYSNRMWKVEEYVNSKIIFSLESADMDQGFPGAVKLYVIYELVKGGIRITYRGTPDQDTIINMTNHSYFNLNGEGSGNILNHMLKLSCDCFTPIDEEAIPYGTVVSVEGTPMDFRIPKPIGRDIEENYDQLKRGHGYDHNFCINRYDGTMKTAVTVWSEESGIQMEIQTDYPGLQMYTANYLNIESGKNGAMYGEREAVCFEPQFYPDAIHHPNFYSPIVKAGEVYQKEIIYHFGLYE